MDRPTEQHAQQCKEITDEIRLVLSKKTQRVDVALCALFAAITEICYSISLEPPYLKEMFREYVALYTSGFTRKEQ